jgi:hypothetical protein
MNAVYESEIEILLANAFDKPRQQAIQRARECDNLRREYPEDSQQRAILDRLYDEIWNGSFIAAQGYLGSYRNCAFSVLHQAFGVDIIAFLFGRAWVPTTTISCFQPGSFLYRLSVLERAFGKFKDGDSLPVLLPETVAFIWPGSVFAPSSFTARQHGLFLRHAFRELRTFGELGENMQFRQQRLKVDVYIAAPDDEYDDEILAFVARPSKQKRISARN